MLALWRLLALLAFDKQMDHYVYCPQSFAMCLMLMAGDQQLGQVNYSNFELYSLCQYNHSQ